MESAKILDLQTLLSPTSVEDFLTNYWARRPIHVKGSPDKYRELFDRPRFDRAIENPDPKGGPVKMRATFNSAMKEAARMPELPITPPMVRQAYAAGATICVTSMDLHDADLGRFVRGIRAELGYPGIAGCNSYLSPHGRGFGMHFDARIACTLQLEGKKYWTFSNDAAVPWPLGNAFFDEGRAVYPSKEYESGEWTEARAFSESEYTTVLLEPGDFLALPAGTWHGARAEGHSLALNLAFEPIPATKIISTLLQDHFESEEAWRSAPPSGQGQQAVADAYMKNRIDEAIRYLQSLSPESEPARRAWGRLVMASASARRAPAITQEVSEISPTDVLCIPDDSIIFSQDIDGGASLKVHVDRHSIDVDGHSREFMRELIKHRRFVAAEARSWFGRGGTLPWEELRDVLASLVEEGILIIVEAR